MGVEGWHGWRKGDGDALHVGRLPGRKSVCLYVIRRHPWVDDGGVLHVGGSIHPLAYFQTEADARICLEMIDQLAAPLYWRER